MTFVRNNIRYRSAASKALEGYYNSKAFILNQLVTPENGFGEDAKEILLLLFNKHAEWLFHTEALLLDKSEVSAFDVDQMQEDLKQVTASVADILHNHVEVFNPEFVRHWTTIHKQKHLVLMEMVEDVKGMTQIIAFPYVTECLIEYLNSTLFELYELDCLLGSGLVLTELSTNKSHLDTLVLHIDDISVQYATINGKSAEMERIAYYEQNILNCEIKINVKVRDYVMRSESDKPRSVIMEELKEFIESHPWLGDFTVVNPNAERPS